MKLGIMQPYFIPYIGYWQLMNAVDKYVIYDDVNYIKGGWVSRNRILVGGEPKYFNVPMLGASPNKLINEVGVNNNESIVDKNLRSIVGAYEKAPFFKDVYPLVESILKSGKENLGEYLAESIYIISDYLGINTEFILSSSMEKNCELRGQEKVLHICSILGATQYYNAIGGQELYSYEDFAKEGIKLSFLKTNEICYKQFNNEFQSNLSILDVMMFNPKERIQEFLEAYSLIEG